MEGEAMPSIMEQPRRVSDAEDWMHEFQCGCSVKFLGSSHHHTSHMTCCTVHAGVEQFNDRHKLHWQAKQALEIAKMISPPM